MSSGAWLDVDLLRQRREQFGHQRPEIVPVRSLLVRGSIYGAVLPALMLVVALGFWLVQWQVDQRLRSLRPIANQHDQLQQQIQTQTQALKSLTSANEGMARSMADVRSSSALLGELRALVPSSVRFSAVKVVGNRLELNGSASGTNALRSINALMLMLEQSALFQQGGVSLKKAELNLQDQQSFDHTFAITALFAADAPKAIRDRLQVLGADGLASRMGRLEQEGLLR